MISRNACVVLLLSLAVLSCTREKPAPAAGAAAGGHPAGQAVSDLAPEIVSASLSPDAPNAATPLTVSYDSVSPGDAPVEYTFRWYVDDIMVREGPEAALAPGPYRRGSLVWVEISPSNSHGQGRPYKTAQKKIGNSPPSIVSISLSPAEPKAGDVMTAVPGGDDPDGDDVSYRYQWTVNGVLAPDASTTSGRFSTQGLKKKDEICVVVTPSDGESTGKPRLSDIVTLFNSAPKITSVPPTSFQNGVYTYEVVAVDPDGDALTYSLVSAPPGMTIDPATGLVRWTPPAQAAGKQEIAIKINVDDGDGGTYTQTYSLVLGSE